MSVIDRLISHPVTVVIVLSVLYLLKHPLDNNLLLFLIAVIVLASLLEVVLDNIIGPHLDYEYYMWVNRLIAVGILYLIF